VSELQRNAFWKFIKFIDQCGYSQHLIIIGSWAEYIYQQSGLFDQFQPLLQTLDIDILIKNKNLPRAKKDMLSDAVKFGYIIDEDTVTGTSKIYMPDDNLEVEFLINQMGSGLESVIHTNIGVNADALRHLSLLSQYAIPVCIDDSNLYVPSPEAYAVHKMMINFVRGRKKEKDVAAISNILPFLDKDKARRIIDALFAKEKKRIFTFLDAHPNLKESLGY